MKRIYIKAYNELKKIGAPVFKEYSNGEPIENGGFKISGESGCYELLDYENYSMGEFGVSMVIVDVLDSYGLYGEWENPGCLNVWEK